jgi:sarcosine oxidase subunit alpha
MIRRKPKKLNALSSLWVDPDRRIRFRFGLGWYRACVGDTIATALFRNGVATLSRGLRFRRPRGLLDLDGDIAVHGVEVDGMPDRPAEATRVRDGMVVLPQSPPRPRPWAPGGFLARFFPPDVGLRPLPWPLRTLPVLRDGGRRAAAGARIDPAFRLPAPMSARYLHCEVCVVGGGPAGMAAALAAAAQGLRVVVVERRPRTGGAFAWRGGDVAAGIPGHRRAAELSREVADHPEIRRFSQTEAVELDGGRVIAVRRGGRGDLFFEERLEIFARSVVAATGRRERPAVFENNDRPGILTADAALGLARLYGVLPGQRAVAAVADDAGLAAALELAELGLRLAAVADRRSGKAPPPVREALEERGVPVLDGWIPFSVGGRKRVKSVALRPGAGGAARAFSADLLMASAGREPVAELVIAAGATPAGEGEGGPWRLESWPERLHPAGGLLGIEDPTALELSGWCAGLAAAADAGADVGAELRRHRAMVEMAPRAEDGGDWAAGWSEMDGRLCFVARDPDVTLEDVEQAVRAGFDHPETAAAYIRNGLGVGPGGVGGEAFRRALAWFRGVSAAEVPPPAAPLPAKPVLAGTLAAGRRDPVRRTPMLERAAASGVLAARIGDWAIPGRYGADPVASDELAGVRAAAGLMDASAMGKFRVFGPGALPALHRVCVNNLSVLKTGGAATAVRCDADGHPLDIGEAARHDQEDFFLTTRPERADDFEDWIRRHAPPDAPPFHVVDLTDAMGTLVLAGAAAGEVLQRVTRYNVSAAALPPLGYRWLRLEGDLPVRVIRTDALAEPCYALHFPASRTAAAWDFLMAAGADLGIRPFGSVAAATLRLRRGGIDLARETDGRTTLVDVGLGKLWGLERTAPRPLGEAAWRRAMGQRGRIQRAFFRGAVNDPVPPDGAVVLEGDRPVGHVCLCRFFPEIRAAMGTALLPEHLARPETRLNVAVSGDPEADTIEVEIRELDQMRWPLHRPVKAAE